MPEGGRATVTVERMSHFDRHRSRLPQPWRTILDWPLTVTVASTFVLVFEAEVATAVPVAMRCVDWLMHRCATCPSSSGLRRPDDHASGIDDFAPVAGQLVVFKTTPQCRDVRPVDGGNTLRQAT